MAVYSRIAKKSRSPRIQVAMAAVAAAWLAGVSPAAFADSSQDLLDKLRAKGVLSEDEYRQLSERHRAEAAKLATKPAAPEAQSTTVGGTAFIDFTHIRQKNDGAKASASGTGLDLKRGYLIVDHKFDDVWSADLTTDFNFVSNDSETQLFVKKLYLQAALSDAVTLRAGSADMPWLGFVDGLWGYRYVENTLVDRLKFGNTADWGLHALGKLGPDGRLSYAVSAVNGSGFRNPTRSERIDWEGRLAFTPIDGMTLAGGFYSGYLGKDVAGTATPVQHAARRWNALAAYVSSTFRVGAEYFRAKNWNQVTAVPEDTSDGYSVWGAYSLRPNLAAFARFDSAKPKKDLAPDFKDRYYTVGLSHAVRRNVDFALAYKHENVKNGSLSTSNGTLVGGTTAEGKYDEIGVWAQVKF